MAKRIKKQTAEEISEISPVFDIDRFAEPEADLLNEWETNGGTPIKEEETEEVLPVAAFLPVEDLKQVTTKVHASVYEFADKMARIHSIHLSIPEDFVVYARLHKDKHKLTTFYQIAEGPLNNLFLDKEEISYTIDIG